ncbi:MAG TPA: AAA family ATPase [Candidatus Binatia bacterium]|nr:AAA family ATPase [Candidatus Binatia bacterium]
MRDRIVGARLARARTSVLLLGPRQVGKSTICRALAPALYVDLADEATFLAYAKDPARLRREVAALPASARVVVDEVQRVPAILNTVQALIDRSEGRQRFVLTGSSARKLRRGGANLLPGRVVLERLDPLTAVEIEDVDLERALRLGMLPGVYWGDEAAPDVLGTYAEVYLREEIQAEAATKNLGSYARFLDVMALASGQWINYSKLSSDVEVPKETVRRFVQLLDDTLLAYRLPPFVSSARTSRRVVQRERVFLFDVGVRNALLGLHRRALGPDQIGGVFEQWVVLQVIYLNNALRQGWRLSTYRTEGGAEVDLIVERDADLVAIEIKAARNVTPADTRGLLSLAEVAGRRRRVQLWVVYRGERPQRFDSGVEAVPVLEALRRLAA